MFIDPTIAVLIYKVHGSLWIGSSIPARVVRKPGHCQELLLSPELMGRPVRMSFNLVQLVVARVPSSKAVSGRSVLEIAYETPGGYSMPMFASILR